MNPILKIENISKQYRLGVVGTGTLSHDLNRWWHTVRGKEDPYLKIGETNDRAVKGDSQYVWALKDISFEVQPGEVLGIIGKNGAGKSTLLKILSQVTGPTTGTIKSRGRIASLLEVGTGFHPELTGKENIYLNGAILGMTKVEIKSKFDEIVEFAGVSRYIDTPVKRYSSGMKVRLAFAVAAHLEPEILVVDEVLAVGDAEFQKKAIGKMQDIAKGEGRTVLFVSHNMAAVKQLCTRGIVLEDGTVGFDGGVEEAIYFYSEISKENSSKKIAFDNNYIGIENFSFKVNNENINNNETLYLGDKLEITLSLRLKNEFNNISMAFDVENKFGELISHISNEDDGFIFKKYSKGDIINITIITNELVFVPGLYFLHLWVGMNHIQTFLNVKNFFNFNLEQGDYTKRTKKIPAQTKLFLKTKWIQND